MANKKKQCFVLTLNIQAEKKHVQKREIGSESDRAKEKERERENEYINKFIICEIVQGKNTIFFYSQEYFFCVSSACYKTILKALDFVVCV